MSQNGVLCVYSTEQPADAGLLLDRILDYLRPTRIDVVSLQANADRSWEQFQSAEDYDYGSKLLPVPQDRREIKNYITADRYLYISLLDSPVATRISGAVAHDIPVAIRELFLPTDPGICIGPHDLFDVDEDDNGFFFGRAFASVQFFGNTLAPDMKEFTRRLLALPELHAVQQELLPIMGATKCCMIWSF